MGKRGFASMDKEKQLEIASKGGRIAHERGLAHKFTSEKAKEAGRIGGLAPKRKEKNEKPMGSLPAVVPA